MSIAYRILTDYAEARIECEGQIYGLEDLCDAIWHLNIELQGCSLRQRMTISKANSISTSC